jgi:hypothetical protein
MQRMLPVFLQFSAADIEIVDRLLQKNPDRSVVQGDRDED